MVWPYHFCRTLEHDVMHGMVEGSRGRGRPKRTRQTDIAGWTGFALPHV